MLAKKRIYYSDLRDLNLRELHYDVTIIQNGDCDILANETTSSRKFPILKIRIRLIIIV